MTLAPRILVSSSDEKYSAGLIVLIASALKRLPAGFELDVVIYDEGLSAATCRELERVVANARTRSRIHFERGFSQLGEELPVARHVTLATFSRLLIPDLSPDLERAVYVDADMLVVDDIAELFAIDLGSALFAACIDKDTPTVRTGVPYAFETLSLPPDRQYFNAGLLVIDVPAWREAGISDATAEFVRRWEPDLRCPDQEGINAVAGDRALALDRRFNFQVSGEGLAATATGDPTPGHRDLKRAAVIHFTGPKPWLGAWFSSTIWARAAARWWLVALGSSLISPQMHAVLIGSGALTAARELKRRVRALVAKRPRATQPE